MSVGMIAAAIGLLGALASPVLAQSMAANPTMGLGAFAGGVLKLQRLAGQMNRCRAMAPQGWYVSGSTPDGTVIELLTQDGAAHAGYSITGVSSVLRQHPSRQWSSPEAFIHTVLSTGGQESVRYGQPQQDELGYIVQPYQKTMVGMVIYKVFPSPLDPGGFVVIVREASTRPDRWAAYGAVALATSMSVRCVAALSLPRGSDFSPGRGPGRDPDDGHEATYNAQLGMEYAHDPRTGDNYWVSPGADHRNGPQGPGYYKSVGNDLVKLEPGRAE